jgi:hypothetical protein
MNPLPVLLAVSVAMRGTAKLTVPEQAKRPD